MSIICRLEAENRAVAKLRLLSICLAEVKNRHPMDT